MNYFEKLGVKVNFFDNADFGSDYPHSNKAYALATLPPNEPFVFFDTDYLFCDSISDLEFNFENPSFIRGPRSWPPLKRIPHSLEEVWSKVYQILGVNKEDVLRGEHEAEDWERYPYYNASLIYFTDPERFARVYLENMKKIWSVDSLYLPRRILYPQLDQIVLPATAAMLGVKPRIYTFPHKRRLRWLHYHDFPYLYFYNKQIDFVSFVNDLLEHDAELSEILGEIPEFAHYFESGMGEALTSESQAWEGETNLRAIMDHLKESGHWLGF